MLRLSCKCRDYVAATAELQKVDLTKLDEAQRKALFINLCACPCCACLRLAAAVHCLCTQPAALARS